MRDWLPNGLDSFSWVFAALDHYAGRRFTNYDLRSNDQLEILALDDLTDYHRWRWPAARIYLTMVTGVYNDIPIILADDLDDLERAETLASVANACDVVYSTTASPLRPKLLTAMLALKQGGTLITPLESPSGDKKRFRGEVNAARRLLGEAVVLLIEGDHWLLAQKQIEDVSLPDWILESRLPDDDAPIQAKIIPVTNQVDYSITYSIPGPIRR